MACVPRSELCSVTLAIMQCGKIHDLAPNADSRKRVSILTERPRTLD